MMYNAFIVMWRITLWYRIYILRWLLDFSITFEFILRCLPDADDGYMWFHSNVFPVWHVPSESSIDATAWFLQTYDFGRLYQIHDRSIRINFTELRRCKLHRDYQK